MQEAVLTHHTHLAPFFPHSFITPHLIFLSSSLPMQVMAQTSSLFGMEASTSDPAEASPQRQCAACGDEGKAPATKSCWKCHDTYYCSTACQRQDWKSHKRTCIYDMDKVWDRNTWARTTPSEVRSEQQTLPPVSCFPDPYR